jgi:hypothetical protein
MHPAILLRTYTEVLKLNTSSAGFEVLPPVVMENSIFMNITPCSPLKINHHFGGTCHFHLQSGRINHTAAQQRWRRYVAPKRQLTFNGPHSVISHNISFFKYQAGWCKAKALDLYSDGSRCLSRLGHLTDDFRSFPQSFQKIPE